jgi:hypothetical protein
MAFLWAIRTIGRHILDLVGRALRVNYKHSNETVNFSLEESWAKSGKALALLRSSRLASQ